MVAACNGHPMFERVPNSELEATDDLRYKLIQNDTEEGQKVSRIHGNKFIAVYRRLPSKNERLSNNHSG